MPVVSTSAESMKAGNRPEWSQVTAAGIFRVKADGNANFDCHFHDCHEYWLVFRGRAKIATEGLDYYMKPGDIVCTKAGEEHDMLEVYDDFEAFYFEDGTAPGGRTGHLHKSADKAQGHLVPVGPLPEDFPT